MSNPSAGIVERTDSTTGTYALTDGLNILPPGKDGFIIVKCSQTNKRRMIGFSTISQYCSVSGSGISYAFYLTTGSQLWVLELGVAKTSARNFSASDSIKITRVKDTIRYYQISGGTTTLLRKDTVTGIGNQVLFADAAIATKNGKFEYAKGDFGGFDVKQSFDKDAYINARYKTTNYGNYAYLYAT